MTWSDEKILKFLKMYKDRPLLWNPSIPGYKNRVKRHNLLMELSGHFDIPKIEVEKKLRSLQSQFARERKKEKHSRSIENNANEVYRSKWFGYKSMLFLVDKNKHRTIKSDNEFSGNEESLQEIKIEDSLGNQDIQHETKPDVKLPSPPASNPIPRIKLQKQFTRPNNPSVNVKRKRHSYSEALRTPVLDEAMQLMRSIHKKIEEKDEYTLYGEQIAIKLRKIPSPRARFVVQNIINKALFNGEMGVYSSDETDVPKTSSLGNVLPSGMPVSTPSASLTNLTVPLPKSSKAPDETIDLCIKSENESDIDIEDLALLL
ncbi:uncharacterized protein LOC129940494 [Eupeodes corollae]|uniref:uncharacterized protein LOC129940494 n=1 Tax=Eupeodes corollae TaxID=290404 RepID=UPI002490F86E|nr:uncharacterized protein LOC129940494 [Eupeodes corollae]